MRLLTIFASEALSVDSKETSNRLKKLIGSFGYALLKRHVRNVNLKIDTKQRQVLITKCGVMHNVTFDEIEALFNE